MKSVWLVVEESFGKVAYPGASVYTYSNLEGALEKANELWHTWRHHRAYANWEEAENPYLRRFESNRLDTRVVIRVIKSIVKDGREEE